MSKLIAERMCARIEGDFVVFLIGLKIHKPWKVHKWWPVFSAVPKIMKELEEYPKLGMLGYIKGSQFYVQYWESFEKLEAYAQNKNGLHLPAWKAFNKSVGKSRGDIGIWHETYQVRAGEYETIYSGMPPIGLGAASKLVPATGQRESARGRIVNA